MNKYEELKVLALKIHKAFMETENFIDLDKIAIQLPNDYWMQALSILNPNDSYVEFHPQSRERKFKICNVTFYNDTSMPEYMRFTK